MSTYYIISYLLLSVICYLYVATILDRALLDCVIDRKVSDITFEAILSPSEHYQNIQDNPEYNSVLPFRIILKIFAVNMLIKSSHIYARIYFILRKNAPKQT